MTTEKGPKEKNNYEKLIDLQSKLLKIGYDGSTPIYKYPTLQKVKEKLQPFFIEYKWALLQPTVIIDGRPVLKTEIIDATTGDIFLEAEFPLSVRTEGNPQEWGKSITYFRRYTLLSLLGLVGDKDDDCYLTDEMIYLEANNAKKVQELVDIYNSIQDERKPKFKDFFARKRAEVQKKEAQEEEDILKETVSEATVVIEESDK